MWSERVYFDNAESDWGYGKGFFIYLFIYVVMYVVIMFFQNVLKISCQYVQQNLSLFKQEAGHSSQILDADGCLSQTPKDAVAVFYRNASPVMCFNLC